MCVCVSVKFFNLKAFIETLPGTISSPVLIVAATKQDKHLRLAWTMNNSLDNKYNLEHDQTTCNTMLLVTLFHMYNVSFNLCPL